ncbi:MAG: GAF domain-containing protein, partial [Sphingobacteriaceae bacterium]
MDNSFGMEIIPENDQTRTQVLARYKILGTPPEHAFDNVARLAAQIFQVPISLVSLVGAEDVFFKANIGMGKVRSSPRGTSLCSLAILNPEVTVFENARIEPCLLANPLVAGSFGLQFYAGAPLVTHDGYAIGTLCIIGKLVRTFSQQDRKVLEGLAKIVMDEIELRLATIEEVEKQQVVFDKLIESEIRASYLVAGAPVAI